MTETHKAAELDHVESPNDGMLRASVFGVSDGLVSNLALVMGVAGGSETTTSVILAGTAGLLAGAFSMAAGEYVSMQTQRETMERQLKLEREHIVRYPEEEQAHLGELLEESGLEAGAARSLAARVHQDVDLSVDFHALHELGIVPEQLGSPVGASIASFLSFVVGAAIPLIPWLIVDDAIVSSIAASSVALLGVGAVVTRVTGRHPLVSGLRQLAIGVGAAAITYSIGAWLGATI